MGMRLRIAIAALGGAIAALPCAALADGCTDEDVRASAAALSQAQAQERSGSLKQAYSAAGAAECTGEQLRESNALRARVALKIAQAAEAKSAFYGVSSGDFAFDWFVRAEQHKALAAGRYSNWEASASRADSDRVLNAYVRQERMSAEAVSAALGRRSWLSSSSAEALEAHARGQFEKAMEQEAKAFASGGVHGYSASLSAFDDAARWRSALGDTDAQAVRTAAARRGDVLSRESTPRSLEFAMRYLGFAGEPGKEIAVKAKAETLGDQASARGDSALAIRYYEVAGSAKGDALREKGEKTREAEEEIRKKKFKDDQKALEDELGL